MDSLTDAEFPSDRIRTASDLVAWALHYFLSQQDAIKPQPDLHPGRDPWSRWYHHLDLDLTFELCLLGLGRYLLVHVHIPGYPHISKSRIDLQGICPNRQGLEAFLQRRPISKLVEDCVLQPLSLRSCRAHQLSAQASVLIETVKTLQTNVSACDSYELLCLAVHSLFVNENLELVALDQTPVINRGRIQFLPSEWNRSRDVYRFGYSCLGWHSNRDSAVADIEVFCLPFRSANHLVVTVQSNIASSDFGDAARRATVKLSVKRFVDAQTTLKNMPLLISIVHNSISKIAWTPVYDSDSLHLPVWILLICLSFLNHSDLCRLRSVSPYFRQLCSHSFLWKSLYCRTFVSNGDETMPHLHEWSTAFMMKWRQRSVK